jgi:multicomponent Na+:H+ antiporter subunit E
VLQPRFALFARAAHAKQAPSLFIKEPTPLPSRSALQAALARGALFVGLWLVLTGAEPFGLPFGLLAAFSATHASMRLLPPGPGRIVLRALPGLALTVLRQSFSAGWDVALRAFARPPRLAPGVIDVPLAIPPGPSRDAFRALASLAPGSLPLEDLPDGRLRLHALDLAMPLAGEIAETEAAFARSQQSASHG